MRHLENYEIVLVGKEDERVLLTFSTSDLPNLPQKVAQATFNAEKGTIQVSFEDDAHWEEVAFINVPSTLNNLMASLEKINVVSINDQTNKVDLFDEVALEKI